ncbi:MAG: NAD-dependent epimerase/dehydratase family protein [Bacillota bacterium]
MKILVLGGTGTISSYLVPQLLERGDRFTLLSRGHRRQPYLGAVEHISVDRFRDGLKPLAGREFDAT